MSANTSKPRQIKPWPELTGLLPLLKADDGISRSSMNIHLDMTNVSNVDAIGLSIFLAKTAQIFLFGKRRLFLTDPKNKKIHEKLRHLNFYGILEALGLIVEKSRDLFSEIASEDCDVESGKIKSIESQNSYNNIICILPKIDGGRAEEIARIKREIKIFFKKDELHQFAHEQVMIILLELVKNTLDHSGMPALLGLKLNLSENGSNCFSFVYCDTGEGICHSVRRHMEKLASESINDMEATQSDKALRKIKFNRLAEKGSFADFIQWALQPGNSTKRGNGINFGLGLMLIVEASKKCGFRVSVKDADTMIVLTELLASNENGISSPYTHSLIRQLGVKSCASPLLVFHGELNLE